MILLFTFQLESLLLIIIAVAHILVSISVDLDSLYLFRVQLGGFLVNNILIIIVLVYFLRLNFLLILLALILFNLTKLIQHFVQVYEVICRHFLIFIVRILLIINYILFKQLQIIKVFILLNISITNICNRF